MRLYLSSFRCGVASARLAELARGNVRTALIANADDYKSTSERLRDTREEAERLRGVGLAPEELDLRDFFGAPPEAVAGALRSFGVVWVRGGKAFLLRRAFRQSGLDLALSQVLAEDALLYAGYSAGVVVLCPTLRGLQLMSDPAEAPHPYDPAPIWEGLGILPYSVLPHFRSDHPAAANAGLAVEYLLDHRIPFRVLRDGDVLVIDGYAEELLTLNANML